ncbi:P-loop containing nucleoside triphosphate hydrolase protein [Pilatotrama ljubarskyi]|nr:P-loop containing nucleoside triphosphate hydrolase protein [Pilatotrama ljubarskyi]
MAPASSRLYSHEEELARSYKVLQAARDMATSKRKYDSSATRSKMVAEFQARTKGKVPYEWQVDVAEALLLGVDCTVIAGTGSGKTMPFVMPAFVEREKVFFVISPLNALESDQASRFAALDVCAAVLNGETFTKMLLEVCVVKTPSFAKKIGAFIIDEAHCITHWGTEFRPEYSTLEHLRSFVPSQVPILATSATLTPAVLAEVRKQLCIRPAHSFHLNLGNDRSNIRQGMRYMRSASDYSALNFMVEGAKNPEDLPRALVFVNAIQKCHAAAHHLRGLVDEHLRNCVGVLHAKQGSLTKEDEWRRFRDGHIRILVATEAAGMGMDVPDITLIVQFGVPETLAVWLQRAGRAGRSRSIQACAIMLVQSSVTQKVEARDAPNESESEFEEAEENMDSELSAVKSRPRTKFKKNIEDGLRAWIETKGCRRRVADAYFDNPPRSAIHRPHQCCDNCSMDATPSQPANTPSTHTKPESDSSTSSSTTSTPDVQAQGDSTSGPQSPKRRTGDHLKNVKEQLRAWRRDTRRKVYKHTSLKADNILPEATLRTIASQRRSVKTVEDLKTILKPPWPFVEVHGDEILHLVKRLNEEYDSQRRAATLEARENRKLATQQRKAEAAAISRLRRTPRGGVNNGRRPSQATRDRWVPQVRSMRRPLVC